MRYVARDNGVIKGCVILGSDHACCVLYACLCVFVCECVCVGVPPGELEQTDPTEE